MTKDSRMLFLKRILECRSEVKSFAALHQLKEILNCKTALRCGLTGKRTERL